MDDGAVHLGPREPLGLEIGEEVLVFALPAPHDRREHLEPSAVGQSQKAVYHLLRSLRDDLRAAHGAGGCAGPREEKAQVIVDLGDGPHRGSRVAVGALLIDRDGRREAFDEIDVRLVHLPKELPRIGGERLHVAALALGEDRIEGEGGLPRTREPGEHDELVPRQIKRDILEIVLARAGDN